METYTIDKGENMEITLKRAMRILDSEAYTIGTVDGNGWLYYFDGKELHDGTRFDLSLEDLINRECIEVYYREERKCCRSGVMELKSGFAFIVTGRENGSI